MHTHSHKMKLNKAENPWVRPGRHQYKGSKKSLKTTKLFRKFQGILNKITPQKFKVLAEQALMLEINTEKRLEGVTDMIFTRVRT